MKKKPVVTGAILGLLIINLVVYYFSYVNGEEGFYYDLSLVTYLLTSLISLVAAIYAINVYGIKNKHGKNLSWIFLGLLGWFSGELIWVVYEFLGKDPFPSIADIFFLLAYPALFVGFFKEYRLSVTEGGVKNKWCNVLPFSFAVSFLLYVIFYLALKGEYTILEDLVSASYYFADFVLVVAVLLVILTVRKFSKGRIVLPWIYIMLGIIAHTVADLSFSFMSESYEENFVVYFATDMFWILGFLFIACGLFTMGLVVKEIRGKLEVKK